MNRAIDMVFCAGAADIAFNRALEPSFFPRMTEEAKVWSMGFQYAPLQTAGEAAIVGSTVVVILGPAGVLYVIASGL